MTNIDEKKEIISTKKEEGTARRKEKMNSLLQQNPTDSESKPIDAVTLNDTYSTLLLGKVATEVLSTITEDKGFRNLLLRQYKEYSSLANEIEYYCSQRKIKLYDNSFMVKMMVELKSRFGTIKNKSNAKLSEMMLQGVNMGIIKLTKAQNRLSDKGLSCEYVDKTMFLLLQNYEDYKLFI